MTRFFYTAHDGAGKWRQGLIQAADEQQARRLLQERNLDPVTLQPDPGLRRWTRKLALLAPVDLQALALGTRQLSTMMASGMDIIRSLEVLQSGEYGARLNLAWADMARCLQRGLPLSRSMNRHPGVFSPVYRGLIKAGETSGALQKNLATLADHLERELKLRQRLSAALTYPAFVFLICLGAIVLLTQKVLPSLIQGLFRESGTELPWITRSVIFLGNALNSPIFYQLVVPLVLLGLVFGGRYLSTTGGRYRAQWLMRRIPLLRELLAATSAARYSRTMGALGACGVPLVHSLELTDMVLADHHLSRAIDTIVVGIENGESLAELVRQSEAFPPLVAGFTELGEETGRLSVAYNHLAEMLEEEIDLLLNTLTSALEPLMIGMMGLIVGYVVVAMFLPLYHMLNTI